jgi:hypothetical protein
VPDPASSSETIHNQLKSFEDLLLQRAYEYLMPRPKPLINEKAYMGMSAFVFMIVLMLLSVVLAIGQGRTKPEVINQSLVKTQLVPNQAETITPNEENQAYLTQTTNESAQFSLSSNPKATP